MGRSGALSPRRLLCATFVSASPQEEPVAYGLSGGWGGARDALGEDGIALDFSVTFEANRVLSGGLKQRLTGHALFDLAGSFDLDRIAGWKDATLAFEAYVMRGHNPRRTSATTSPSPTSPATSWRRSRRSSTSSGSRTAPAA
jgi:carbohydrate-selective porin OprB